MEEVVRFSGSNEVNSVPQANGFLILQLPFHKQLTLRHAQSRLKVIYILPRDLVNKWFIAIPSFTKHNTQWSIKLCIAQILLALWFHEFTHSGMSTWCYSPAFFGHLPIFRNVQSNFTMLKSDSKCGLLLCEMTIVLSDDLQWNKINTACVTTKPRHYTETLLIDTHSANHIQFLMHQDL